MSVPKTTRKIKLSSESYHMTIRTTSKSTRFLCNLLIHRCYGNFLYSIKKFSKYYCLFRVLNGPKILINSTSFFGWKTKECKNCSFFFSPSPSSSPHHSLGLLSMLRSDWLSYYQAIYVMLLFSLVAKSAGFENQNNGSWIAFCQLSKLFCPISLTN